MTKGTQIQVTGAAVTNNAEPLIGEPGDGAEDGEEKLTTRIY